MISSRRAPVCPSTFTQHTDFESSVLFAHTVGLKLSGVRLNRCVFLVLSFLLRNSGTIWRNAKTTKLCSRSSPTPPSWSSASRRPPLRGESRRPGSSRLLARQYFLSLMGNLSGRCWRRTSWSSWRRPATWPWSSTNPNTGSMNTWSPGCPSSPPICPSSSERRRRPRSWVRRRIQLSGCVSDLCDLMFGSKMSKMLKNVDWSFLRFLV